MGSGKYGAVSGLIGRMQMMDNISEHLAAVRTTAYKKGKMTFEAQLGEATSGMASKAVNYTRVTKEQIDFSPGQMGFTGEPLHVGINGDGFFQIKRADGSLAYSRNGSFTLNSQGELITSEGLSVLSAENAPIILPRPDVNINVDGTIYDGAEVVGKIGLFQFADNSVLQRAGTGMYVAGDGSNPVPHPNPQLMQKNLEESNVDMMRTMVRMTANLRTFEATQKALKIYSDMGAKAAEIGIIQ